ncbi:MAG: hypothetical protein LBL73_11100 [Synergistaceae bacterium]|jgi:hypothetical protein|nr:hypothetical protein [Synergistaceae bacterium]
MRSGSTDKFGSAGPFRLDAIKGVFICGFAAAALLAAILFARPGDDLAAWAAAPLRDVFPPYKEDLVLEDNNQILVARKANVLFVLDTGSPMTFTATGTMPDMGTNRTLTQKEAGQMLREATYGHGGLPFKGADSVKYDYGGRGGRERYGREGPDPEDEKNNMTTGNVNLDLHMDNYYSPFNYANNELAKLYSDIPNGDPLPYALVFKDTKRSWWKNGPPAGATINKGDLVPNDSRMYKMKLVMWRVLSDVVLVENLRMGLATTYQEMMSPKAGFYADFYKKDPYGKTKTTAAAFPYGTGPGWATGLADGFGDGGAYKDSTAIFWGINREYYDARYIGQTKWKLLNRAYLRVPMNDYETAHINKFRLWIDGLENVADGGASDPYYFKNPELFGDGKTFLSTAIYPGHRNLTRAGLLSTIDAAGQRAVTFSSTKSSVKAAMDSSYRERLFNQFKQGSGEALGTVMDFFSPPVAGIGGVTTSASNVQYAPENSFPLSDPCDKNWVVIFTAGDDSSEYSSAQAVKDLYDNTKGKDLTSLIRNKDGTPVKKANGENQFTKISLEEGVRTLVVGFVDPDSEADSVVRLREKLNAMAIAGDPGNPDAKAYFANDVSGLVQALRAVLARINNEIQPAPGPFTESPAMKDEENTDPDQFNIFSAGYRINKYDQWAGSFARYQSIKKSGSITATELWELGRDLRRSLTPGSRNLVFWSNKGAPQGRFEKMEFTSNQNDATEHPLAAKIGITDAFVSDMNATNIPQNTFTGKLHPSRALVNWLFGYEYSYIGREQLLRRSLIADFGQSTSVLVGPPRPDDTLPGYREWAESQEQKKLETRVFAQTNDGILHVINPKLGIPASQREQMAIVPPPSLLPLRLAALKMTKVGDDSNHRMRWLDVNDYMTETSDDIPISSKPAYVLDGPVRLRRFDMGPSKGGWKSFLVAILGRAGNGMYMMDVSAPDDPKFSWYRETVENDDGSLSLIRMRAADADVHTETVSPDWGDGSGSIYDAPGSYPFYQLGFNSRNAAAGVMRRADGVDGLQNIIVLPGGMQRGFDLADNGKMGAALYIIDPDESKHADFNNDSGWAKVYNSGSVDPQWRVGSANSGPAPYMGMMVSPPTLRASQYGEYSKSVTGQVFASDNRGNIFALLLEPETAGGRGGGRLLTAGSLRMSSDEPAASYASPYGVLISKVLGNSGAWWASGGTANITGETTLQNKSQLIYSFKLPNFSTGRPSMRDEWVELVKSGDRYSQLTVPDAKGWYITLEPDGQNYKEEYVSAQPVLFGNHIYFATFLPKKMDLDTVKRPCNVMTIDGKSRIYALGVDAGAGGWRGGNAVKELDGAKIVSMTPSSQGGKRTLEATVDILDQAVFIASAEAHSGDVSIDPQDGGSWAFMTLNGGKGSVHNSLPPGTTLINYWIMK